MCIQWRIHIQKLLYNSVRKTVSFLGICGCLYPGSLKHIARYDTTRTDTYYGRLVSLVKRMRFSYKDQELLLPYLVSLHVYLLRRAHLLQSQIVKLPVEKSLKCSLSIVTCIQHIQDTLEYVSLSLTWKLICVTFMWNIPVHGNGWDFGPLLCTWDKGEPMAELVKSKNNTCSE